MGNLLGFVIEMGLAAMMVFILMVYQFENRYRYRRPKKKDD